MGDIGGVRIGGTSIGGFGVYFGALAKRQCVMTDYLSLLPDTRRNGRPIGTLRNLEVVCERTGFALRFNEDSERVEISVHGAEYSPDEAYVGYLAAECARFDMPLTGITRLMRLLAFENRYMPTVRKYRPEDPVATFIRLQLDWMAPRTRWRWMSAKDLLEHSSLTFGHSEISRVGRIVRKLNGGRAHRIPAKRLMLVPPLRQEKP